MERSIGIAINKFPVTPNSLRKTGSSGDPVEQIRINLAGLFHHYYLDNYGRTPPDPDPAQFEYLKFLSPTPEFRIQSDGLGISTAAKRHRSNELGQAFCRLFLYDHLNITYFAHLEHILDKNTHKAFNGLSIERSKAGDVPDYFCAEDVHQIYIAEAKGRYTSIGFNTKEFSSWREQFGRIAVRDKYRKSLRVKGYIVGTRFATEEDSTRIQSKIYAEDPETSGEFIAGESNQEFPGAGIISLHYGGIAEKINQPILAAALLGGYTTPPEIQFPAIVWEIVIGPLTGNRFVGGYYSKDTIRIIGNSGTVNFGNNNPFDLASPGASFFGVEQKVFEGMVDVARRGSLAAVNIPVFENIQPFYSGMSLLRDGSLIAPLDFLRPVDSVSY